MRRMEYGWMRCVRVTCGRRCWRRLWPSDQEVKRPRYGRGFRPLMRAPDEAAAEQEEMHYARVCSDTAGESHFEDKPLEFQQIQYAPPARSFSVSLSSVQRHNGAWCFSLQDGRVACIQSARR